MFMCFFSWFLLLLYNKTLEKNFEKKKSFLDNLNFYKIELNDVK